MHYHQGDRVTTPDGRARVIKDCREPWPECPTHDRVWVLLDVGDNPQRYRPEELS